MFAASCPHADRCYQIDCRCQSIARGAVHAAGGCPVLADGRGPEIIVAALPAVADRRVARIVFLAVGADVGGDDSGSSQLAACALVAASTARRDRRRDDGGVRDWLADTAFVHRVFDQFRRAVADHRDVGADSARTGRAATLVRRCGRLDRRAGGAAAEHGWPGLARWPGRIAGRVCICRVGDHRAGAGAHRQQPVDGGVADGDGGIGSGDTRGAALADHTQP